MSERGGYILKLHYGRKNKSDSVSFVAFQNLYLFIILVHAFTWRIYGNETNQN